MTAAKKKPKSRYDTIMVRPELKTVDLADRFAEILSREKGVRVYRADAVHEALAIAIDRKTRK